MLAPFTLVLPPQEFEDIFAFRRATFQALVFYEVGATILLEGPRGRRALALVTHRQLVDANTRVGWSYIYSIEVRGREHGESA